MRFAKGHGTENDFVILPDPDASLTLTDALAVRLCDRRAGIGADGVLRVVRTAALESQPAGAVRSGEPAPEWFMDYRNSDGSLAGMCGNGIRVFARYLAAHGLVGEPEFTIGTRSGPRRVALGAGREVTVDMGPVGVLGEGRAVVGGRECTGLRISVGNPHLACLVGGSLAGYDLTGEPQLDPQQFPDGANVELLQISPATGKVIMRVRERGSGETRSCGTGAVAAAVAAGRAQGQDEGSWRVAVPGGELGVTVQDGTAELTGPAVIVAEGELDPYWLAAAQ